MRQRIITALVAVVILFAILAIGRYAITPAIVIVSIIGLWELFRALKKKFNVMDSIAYIFLFLNFAALIFLREAIIAVNVIFVITMFACMVLKYKKYNIVDVAVTMFAYFYVVILFSYLYLLTELNSNNLFWLFASLVISWGADMGGYFIGMFFGKHKLCERLSPKKTIEGALGGLLASLVLFIILTVIYGKLNIYDTSILLKPSNIVFVILGTVLLSVLAQIGDFVASSIKRHVDVKDYSNIMPGHGGILDRFDSVIFITPLIYYLVVLLEKIL